MGMETIFNEIVDIMRNDYAGWKDKIGWDNPEFFVQKIMYPTSGLSRIDKGEGMTGKGIDPDIYIPWTPEHLETVVDVRMALKVLASETEWAVKGV
jgi:hypothetical protein